MVLTHAASTQDLTEITKKDERFELVEGVLTPMAPVDLNHGRVHANLFRLLDNHVHQRRLGQVVSEVGFTLKRDPDSVLAPDLAFIGADRYPEEKPGFVELAPDLIVEIISPGNVLGDIERKVAIYLEAGVTLIWIVYPRQRQIVAHTPDNPPAVFAESDQISGGEVLPGLVIPVSEVFA